MKKLVLGLMLVASLFAMSACTDDAAEKTDVSMENVAVETAQIKSQLSEHFEDGKVYSYEFYEYNEDGKLIGISGENYGLNSSTVQTFTYESNVEKVIAISNIDGIESQIEYITTYEDAGNILSEASYINGELERRVEYTYVDGLQTSAIDFDASGVEIQKLLNEYDAQGRQTKSTSSYYGEIYDVVVTEYGEGDDYSEFTYYDDTLLSQRQVTYETLDDGGKVETVQEISDGVLRSTSQTVYDKDGNILEAINERNLVSECNETVYIYENGLLVQENYYEGKDLDSLGDAFEIATYEYDADSKMLKSSQDMGNFITNYIYDENGNLSEEIRYLGDEISWKYSYEYFE